MRAAAEGGLAAGWRALRLRGARCRPRYEVYYDHQTRDWRVALADGASASGAEVADFITGPYRAALAESEAAHETVIAPASPRPVDPRG
jgi:hypothetical protein